MQPHSLSIPTKPCHAIGNTFRHSLTKRDTPSFGNAHPQPLNRLRTLVQQKRRTLH
nr:MAG TPA: hypothetical protein [Caudoviricetes sp.]